MSNINKDLYTVFLKIKDSGNSFIIAGSQFGFKYKNDSDLSKFHNDCCIMIQDSFAEYNLLDDDIQYIQLSFKQQNVKLLHEFSYDIFSNSDGNSTSYGDSINSDDNLPISIAESSLGDSLVTELDVNNNIYSIKLNVDNRNVNFLDVIKEKSKHLKDNHVNKITHFTSTFKFYYLQDIKYKYVLATR